MAANCPIPAVMAGSRRMPARVTRGKICFSSSSHLPLMPYSNDVKPVALPPGRDRVATTPAPTGSINCTKTMGTLRVACCRASTVVLVEAKMTSGESATSSAAYLRVRSALPAPQRISVSRLLPAVQPDVRSPCKKAAKRACPSGSLS